MLDVKQATKVFSAGTASEHHALNGLDLHLDDGEFVTIIGSNGAGKSTLFNAICGNYWLDQGQIFLDGQDITFLSEHRRARQIGRVFQDPMKGTAPHLTIEENLALAYTRKDRKPFRSAVRKQEKDLFRTELEKYHMDLENRMKTKVGLLSGGQRQVVTLLMCTLVMPKLLLLDEHTDGLTRAASAVKAAGGNALVLQMKAPGGTLSWKSGVSDAAAYGVNGTAELADAIQTVKGQNIYLVAVVSTCVDTLMAERYAATALQTASGSAYTDSSGGWVDPYNTFIRTYLVSLCKELHDLGFDEVAFSYLQQPLSDTEVKYASQSGTPSRTDAVVSLAKYLRANLTATGLRVSAVVSADSILQSRAAQSGQDMAVFPKLFDRVCVFASADNVATLQSAIAADSSFDAATRFVPFLAKAPESGSYVTTG